MPGDPYRLDEQVGFLLRKANQRHRVLFSSIMGRDVLPMQFAALAKLVEIGPISQNELGRLTAMDSATIKGVVDRLVSKGLLSVSESPDDGRLSVIDLTDEGRDVFDRLSAKAVEVSDATVSPLTFVERATLQRLLDKIS